MKVAMGKIRLAATDLGNHLACRHLTALDLQVAQGKRAEPEWAAPDLAVIIERGERHEREYLAHLCAQGLTVENLSRIPHKEEERLLAETLALMERGAEVIAQGALSDGEWFGRPDGEGQGLAKARLNDLLSFVQIYQALGGGWQQ